MHRSNNGMFAQPWLTTAAPYRLVTPSQSSADYKEMALRTLASFQSARETMEDLSPVFMLGGVVSMLFAMAAVIGLGISLPASF